VEQAASEAACECNMGYAKSPEDKLVSRGTFLDKNVVLWQGTGTR
jgi:hypothetical protein